MFQNLQNKRKIFYYFVNFKFNIKFGALNFDEGLSINYLMQGSVADFLKIVENQKNSIRKRRVV